MSTITTKDGTAIYYKDWGPKNGSIITFRHGWRCRLTHGNPRCSSSPRTVTAVLRTIGAGTGVPANRSESVIHGGTRPII